MEIHPPEMSQGENDYQDQKEIDPTEMSQGENDYQDQKEIDPTEMSQGGIDNEEVQRLIDQMEIGPTEISQHYNIDDQKVRCLSEKLNDGAQKTEFFFSSPCIYRVPNELRKLNDSAYTPRVIAIGPLHREDPHLQTPMQLVKMSYANNLLCRVSEVMEGQESAEQKNLTVLRECMEAIKASLDDAKKCYPEEVTLDVEMMLVDGCFILEFLYRYFWIVVQFILDVEMVPPNSKVKKLRAS